MRFDYVIEASTRGRRLPFKKRKREKEVERERERERIPILCYHFSVVVAAAVASKNTLCQY